MDEPRFSRIHITHEGAILYVIDREWNETRVVLDKGELARLTVDAAQCLAGHASRCSGQHVK